ncbi:MAG: Nif11-like leader peptide family natural product precursor [Alkalinema sp. FL-bin-369]|jgi:predicted ribosomally synthesized peptide with nif11-like leader|nr:Nif11-like leader peptide family natural product precursor [Leptolyngbyaceae cyanobacterium LF-bin-369]
MSIKSAARFLSAASKDQVLRDRFSAVESPEDFLCVSQQMGYSFTTDELKKLVVRQSRSVQIRRDTGVWHWLRNVNWI